MSASPQAATLPRSRRGLAGALDRLRLHHLALAAVLAGSAVLNLHRISQNGYGNIFYSAGVRSMLRSWHNFFFVSFDPGGLITVDKPPLGLWVQALSAKLFGFSSLSLLLPEAIIGVLSVALVYLVLAKRLGGWAGVAGALALAIFPSFVAISRTNNVDALLILLMILACEAALRACENGRWGALVCSGVLVGLAFNTKTLAGCLVIPGIGLGFLLCAPGSLRRRLLQLLVAGAAMLAVSAAWMAAVEATPASKRPFVGSSTDNTELGLTFSYNGFGRVGGQTGGPGQIPVGAGGVAKRVSTPGKGGAAAPSPVHTVKAPSAPPTFLPNGRERNPIAFGEGVGPLRLFERGLGNQGAWLLPFALLGLIALALLVLGRERERRDPRLALLLVMGAWFLLEAGVLSLSKGIVHPYYVSALGPGVAAMVGAGAYAFAQLAKRRDWRLALLAIAAATTVAAQLALLHRDHYMAWFTAPLIAVTGLALLTVLGLALLPRLRSLAAPAVALVLGALCIAPAVYAASNWLAPVQSTFPAAGPRAASGPGGYGVNDEHVSVDRALLRYVEGHGAGTRWSVLADASNTASPMILLGGLAGSLGGFSGTDPALDGPGLAVLVQSGQARYVLLGGEFSTRGGTKATEAVQRLCRVVPTRTWLPRPLEPNGLILFDCRGRVSRLAAA
ncbi:MAG TPA: glycosyltransferase family 39 protein [Solirubrobacteraceae bacterium]|jgi:4-amino-4-deoxy-L-arabinose transferase-like glycosyltransferase|nr:glycosyltransferase family 39 protein [Solirubrobacteraceae bacterium]